VSGAQSGGCDLADGLRFAGKAKRHAGFGGVVIMDQDTCMVKGAWLPHHALLRHESCGWCIPAAKARLG